MSLFADLKSAGELLGAEGPFAHHIDGFAPRIQQQQMSDAVEQALDNQSVLVCEAGTGTGKTFAYLVPALRFGKRVIISTGTKTLQDQLFHRDLPTVQKALVIPARVTMLKGRSNYLCIHRLDLLEHSGSAHAKHLIDDFQAIRQWAGKTSTGDVAEITGIDDDAPIWPQVTSTSENCLGQECNVFSDCHVVKARKRAQEADVVVINHHLLFSDMVLKEEGFGELLPSADAFIIDEAHQLPEIASNFFGQFLSGRQLLDLGRDVIAEQLTEAGDMPALARAAQDLEKELYDFRLALGMKKQRAPWSEIRDLPAVKGSMETIETQLQTLSDQLEEAAVRGKGLESCWQRSLELIHRLQAFSQANEEERIQWYETTRRSFMLHDTPMNIAETFDKHARRYKSAWVYTSATLAVGDNFDHFTKRLGVENAETARWDSPFNFRDNSVLYLPEDLPEPNSPQHVEAVVDKALPILEACGGGAFMLFTSHRALRRAAELLEEKGFEAPLLIQGNSPRNELLDTFRRLGNAVLLGTSSFWEGVDVRGEALSCVIIDKLPFVTPDDPVLQARMDALKKSGGNPFRDFLLPNAVITLKQGSGRLIRDVNDRGVLMLCDPRLVTKSYGKTFLKNMPPMRRTRDESKVVGFCGAMKAKNSSSVTPAKAEISEP